MSGYFNKKWIRPSLSDLLELNYIFRHNGLAEMAVVAIENLEYIARHTLNAALSMVCTFLSDTKYLNGYAAI